jgi:hypothetical protein
LRADPKNQPRVARVERVLVAHDVLESAKAGIEQKLPENGPLLELEAGAEDTVHLLNRPRVTGSKVEQGPRLDAGAQE